jgi:AcrR family transcriptional regulator
VSAEEIVQQARVARGALYHHFKDKKDLFDALCDELGAEMSKKVEDVVMPLAQTDPFGAVLAGVARPGLQNRHAVVEPRTPTALRDPHRHHCQLDARVRGVHLRDGDDVQTEVELEVVDLHRRPELRGARGRRRAPDRRVEVVPNDAALDADDPAVASVRGGEAGGLEHPLVVRELEQVVSAFARGECVVVGRVLEGGQRELGDAGRRVFGRVEGSCGA